MNTSTLTWTIALSWSLTILLLVPTETMRIRAEDAALAAHQEAFHCLVDTSAQLPSCQAALAKGPEDADFCPEAVQSCGERGFPQAVESASDRTQQWRQRSVIARLLTVVVALGTLIPLATIASRRIWAAVTARRRAPPAR